MPFGVRPSSFGGGGLSERLLDYCQVSADFSKMAKPPEPGRGALKAQTFKFKSRAAHIQSDPALEV